MPGPPPRSRPARDAFRKERSIGMKKRALSLLMSLVMLVSMLPTTAWAASEDQKSVTVQASFYDGESQQFTMPPQNLKVNSGEATKLEYMTDNLAKNADKVTVFDALVAVHEELLGLDKADAEVLDISDTGFVSTVMGAGYKAVSYTHLDVYKRQPHGLDSNQ